jgi:8-oxo-dGTP pyrophosphatase MutT (NUDIX family)
VSHQYEVLEEHERYRGAIFTVVSQLITMPGGGTAWRDVVRNLGAAVVIALDDDGRIVLVRQYRSVIGQYMWEVPAGLADVAGESGLATARRELAEEADLVAGRWDLLAEVHTSPGFSTEFIRVFLARDLSPAAHTHVREHEEADMTVERVDLDEAVAMVFRGEITNGADVVGILAAARARDLNWAPLRPAV